VRTISASLIVGVAGGAFRGTKKSEEVEFEEGSYGWCARSGYGEVDFDDGERDFDAVERIAAGIGEVEESYETDDADYAYCRDTG